MRIAIRLRTQVALCCCLLIAAPAIFAADPDVSSIHSLDACIHANIPPALQVKQLSLSTTDASGQGRTLKGRLFAQRQDGLLRSMLKLESPPDLRGAAYLLREARGESDGMYMFLPALNKTRRIVGGSQNNPLFGTDISYADVRQISLAFGGGHASLEAPQTLQGRSSQVVLVVPDPAQQSAYSGIRAWIDSKTCVVMRADFIAGKDVRKRYSAAPADLKQNGTHWYAAKSVMEDLLSKSRTELVIDGIVSSEGLSDNYFNPRSFHLGN